MAVKETVSLIGDRILVRPAENSKSPGGLYLPETSQDKQKTMSGFVVKTGPGYLVESGKEAEDWLEKVETQQKHIPLQVKANHYVVFIKEMSFEIMIENEKYYVMPQAAVLIFDSEYF